MKYYNVELKAASFKPRLRAGRVVCTIRFIVRRRKTPIKQALVSFRFFLC